MTPPCEGAAHGGRYMPSRAQGRRHCRINAAVRS
eukprot:CAMPEP_0176131728 /NCGR_PEP_ID=MMETSP0120_2-20121206/66699_1 /TAXON_ID=160619 /ORGANISM="Kryptoperidinium foliaceum, Strain CCMP 1326" /LENGTH=33 /DNA_ID= /DNA_START= /DNA_END= /DNA_ORIENTATION=